MNRRSLRNKTRESIQPKIICFAGNPNVGKSSWINALSNATFTIGNYPGVTVEKKEATVKWGDTFYHLIDLPGIYSLQCGANEESVAIDFLRTKQIDVIVNVIDTTDFVRNCELMLELRELQIPMLILLNFQEEAVQQNIVIELEKLQQLLNIKMILCDAKKRVGIEEIKASIAALSNEPKGMVRHPFYVNECIAYKKSLTLISSLQTTYLKFSEAMMALYALKWCEQDQWYISKLKTFDFPFTQGYEVLKEADLAHVTNYRTDIIHKCAGCIQSSGGVRLRLTRKIDHLLLHNVLSLPIFVFIMILMFGIPFLMSQPLTLWMEQFINTFVMHYATKMLFFLPPVLTSLLQNGLLQGTGNVLAFLPMLACLYFCMAVLEESGYFARVACLFDRWMRPLGMSGRSLVCLMLGFGCNVPAIVSTRSLHDERAKKITALLVPFISCSARLPVFLMFAYAFFSKHTIWVVLTLYALGIWIALVLAVFIQRFMPYQKTVLFTMELPPYRLPSISFALRKTAVECGAFVRKSLSVICSSMMILHLLVSYPGTTIEDSYLIKASEIVAPIFMPLGFGDRAELVAALPGAIVSKENVIGFLGQVMMGDEASQPLLRTISFDIRGQMKQLGSALLSSLSLQMFRNEESKEQAEGSSLVKKLANLWSDERKELRAFSFLVYILLSIPCVMTMLAIRREYGIRLLLLSLGMMVLIPYIMSFLIFQGFSLLY